MGGGSNADGAGGAKLPTWWPTVCTAARLSGGHHLAPLTGEGTGPQDFGTSWPTSATCRGPQARRHRPRLRGFRCRSPERGSMRVCTECWAAPGPELGGNAEGPSASDLELGPPLKCASATCLWFLGLCRGPLPDRWLPPSPSHPPTHSWDLRPIFELDLNYPTAASTRLW